MIHRMMKFKSPFFLFFFIMFGKSQIGSLLIRLHLFHIILPLIILPQGEH